MTGKLSVTQRQCFPGFEDSDRGIEKVLECLQPKSAHKKEIGHPNTGWNGRVTTSGSVLPVGIRTYNEGQQYSLPEYFLWPMVDFPTYSNIQQGIATSKQCKGQTERNRSIHHTPELCCFYHIVLCFESSSHHSPHTQVDSSLRM